MRGTEDLVVLKKQLYQSNAEGKIVNTKNYNLSRNFLQKRAKCVLHPLIHTFPFWNSAQDFEKKKAEPKTPHFLSLNQDIVAESKWQKCELTYVIHTPSLTRALKKRSRSSAVFLQKWMVSRFGLLVDAPFLPAVFAPLSTQ